MVAHILQIAYYTTLRDIRTHMLQAASYRVTSVLGNDEAMLLNGELIAAADLVVVGFSAEHSVRAAMVHWFKVHYAKIPVVALQFYEWEKFPEADVATLSEDPKVWLAAVAGLLKA
jgi:hypothetical protein